MTGADVYRTWGRLADKAFTVAVRGSFASFGARSTIQRPARLRGESNISIGSGVFVGSSSWLQTIEQSGHPRPQLVIGDGTSFSGHCVVVAARGVHFGRAVLVARNVYVSDHHHRYCDGELPILAQGLDGVAPVVIGDGAWLCQNVVICAGVTVGRGAIVAANSVVKADIPDRCLAAGAPARIVRVLDAPDLEPVA